jgi:hypothetical protein
MSYLIGLIGIVVGAGIAGGINIYLVARREARDIRGAARAIRGEISGICDIIRARQFVEVLRNYAASADEGDVSLFRARVKEEYFWLLKQNLSHVGSMGGDLPNKIARFLTLTSSAMEDIHRLYDEPNTPAEFGAPGIASFYSDLAAIIFSMLELGDSITQEIDALYPRSSRRFR